MSRKDVIMLASRTLAMLLMVWALSEVSYLPASVHSFLRYRTYESGSTASVQYWRHYYLISLGFHIVRVVGFSLVARWLYQGGSEVEKLLLSYADETNPAQE